MKYLLLLLLSSSVMAGSGTAKQKLYKFTTKLYYTGCSYVHHKSSGIVVNDCGYVPRKDNKRAHRVELEHIVTASRLGKTLDCWGKGGRKLCEHDESYKTMAYDLHNLVLAVGEINGNRSNREFGMVSTGYKYGKPDVYVSYIYDKIQPPKNKRGDIARIYYYAAHKYGIVLSKRERLLFEKWNREDPVSVDEVIRDSAIYLIQHNHNPFVVTLGCVIP